MIHSQPKASIRTGRNLFETRPTTWCARIRQGPPGPSAFVESYDHGFHQRGVYGSLDSTSSQLQQVSETITLPSEAPLDLSGIMPDFGAPGIDLLPWGSLGIILCDLGGRYRPRHEWDNMLIKSIDIQISSETRVSLRMYGKRGTLRAYSGYDYGVVIASSVSYTFTASNGFAGQFKRHEHSGSLEHTCSRR